MKSRLNITIEEDLIGKVKYYAETHHTSVSELVEEYFRTLSKPPRKKNILDLVKALPKPAIDLSDADLKDLYYKERGTRHGF